MLTQDDEIIKVDINYRDKISYQASDELHGFVDHHFENSSSIIICWLLTDTLFAPKTYLDNIEMFRIPTQ